MLIEAKKISIIRIILATLQILRTVQIGWCYYHYQNGDIYFEESFYLIFSLSLLTLFLVGKWPVVVSILCAVIIPKLDAVLLVPSIANNLFSFMCLFFAAYAYFIQNQPTIDTEEQERRLDTLYWLLFLSYASINLMSAIAHLEDPYWKDGTAMAELVKAGSIGRFSQFFQELSVQTTWFYPLMKIVTWSVLLSQLLLIPLYIFRQTRWLLLAWVVVLLVFIFGFLQVVMLPHYTVLLFVLLLYRKTKLRFGTDLLSINKSDIPIRRLSLLLYVCIGFQIATNTDTISKRVDKVFWLTREWDTKLWLNKKMNLLGFGKPNVLNTDEIEGSQHWFTVHKIVQNKPKLVPFIDEHGNRLNYYPDFLMFGNQGSDYIKKNLIAYGLREDTFTYLNSSTPYKEKGRAETRLIKFDYSASFSKGTVQYWVQYFTLKKVHHSSVAVMVKERKYNCIEGKVLEITH